ncbi:MAG: DUF6790 family protein [Methylovirgula sp.]|uniref:DUF6790 family protein n=1 Tax=Methylovirgula sp. TaxID=1978224 RepID=UPI0030762264
MAAAIPFALSNFTVTLFVIGLIASCFALARAPKPLGTAIVVEALFSYFLLFSIGVSFFYNFVMHTFFGDMAARFIGWANSPFQTEVGFASLGYAVVGFLAFRGGFGLRLAAIIGPSLFLLGAAGGHVYQIAKAQNLAPGNSGAILYSDVLIPAIGFALLWLQSRCAPMRAKG